MRFLLSIFLFIILSLPHITLAESIFLENNGGISTLGGSSINVNLDLSKSNVNAVDGRIIFEERDIKISSINVDGTSIRQWIKPPQYKNGSIEFSGLIPNGLPKGGNRLFKIILGTTNIKYKEVNIESSAKIYVNDGKGTEINIPSRRESFKVIKNASKETLVIDNVPPQLISFSIGQNSEIFDGNYFLMFEIKDKESANIKSEILLSNNSLDPLSLRGDNKKPWKEVSNPALIDDNKLCSYIYLRLRDEVGNVSVYSIYEPKELSPCLVNRMSKTEVFSGIIYKIGAVFVLLILVWRLFLYGKKKSNL